MALSRLSCITDLITSINAADVKNENDPMIIRAIKDTIFLSHIRKFKIEKNLGNQEMVVVTSTHMSVLCFQISAKPSKDRGFTLVAKYQDINETYQPSEIEMENYVFRGTNSLLVSKKYPALLVILPLADIRIDLLMRVGAKISKYCCLTLSSRIYLSALNLTG